MRRFLLVFAVLALCGYGRVRVHFYADRDHLSSDSAWLVFRVTT